MTINEVSRQQALERLEANDATFVDIRDPNSYIEAHIPGALNIGNHNMEDFIANRDPAVPVIVYCYHGISSRSAAAHFMHHGFQDVSSMSGGFAVWGDAPSERGIIPNTAPPAPRRTEAGAKDDPSEKPAPEDARPHRRRDLFRRVRNLLKP